MPTPMPSIAASCVAKSGVETAWLTSWTKPIPMPIPNRAVTVAHPGRRAEHDLPFVSGAGGEPRREEVSGALRLGSREREALSEGVPEGARDHRDAHETREPQQQDAPAPAVAPRGETLQHVGL